ncbi:MAG: N-acetyltransferase family protein [Alphaproteobacteria bacterium]
MPDLRDSSSGSESEPSGVLLRPGRIGDLERLTTIYNHWVRESAWTLDLDEVTLEERRAWFDRHGPSGRHRLIVAEVDGRVAGWSASTAYRPRRGFDATVETSVYLDPLCTGRGLGTRLYRALLEALRSEDVHRVVAAITLPNPASIALHERLGFARVGCFRECGRKHGRFWDVLWMERGVEPGDGPRVPGSETPAPAACR